MICTVAVGFVGFKIAKKLKAPAPAMIGSMIAVGITNIAFDYAYLPVVLRILLRLLQVRLLGYRSRNMIFCSLKAFINQLFY